MNEECHAVVEGTFPATQLSWSRITFITSLTVRPDQKFYLFNDLQYRKHIWFHQYLVLSDQKTNNKNPNQKY